jgi:hypothetical protein
MEERRARVTEADSIDDSVEILEDPHAKGSLYTKGVAIYHVVFCEEDFATAAGQIFALVRAAQEKQPNKKRYLFLDIEGHRTRKGGFDKDMFELQRHFLLGFMLQYMSEIHMPLIGVRSNKAQVNDLPETLQIVDEVNKEVINRAIDQGVEQIWVSDKDRPLRLR